MQIKIAKKGPKNRPKRPNFFRVGADKTKQHGAGQKGRYTGKWWSSSPCLSNLFSRLLTTQWRTLEPRCTPGISRKRSGFPDNALSDNALSVRALFVALRTSQHTYTLAACARFALGLNLSSSPPPLSCSLSRLHRNRLLGGGRNHALIQGCRESSPGRIRFWDLVQNTRAHTLSHGIYIYISSGI